MNSNIIRIYLIVFNFIFCFSLTGYTQGSWNVIPNAPTDDRIDDICFVNNLEGYLCDGFVVHKTFNKGNNWIPIGAVDTNSVSFYARSIEFVNDSIGFIGLLESVTPLLGSLYKTTNSGYDWTLLQNMQILPDDGICGMAHFGNRLVAVGTYSGPAWFYKTDDFGVSWTKVDLSSLAFGLVDCYMISHDTILVSGMAEVANQQAATILQSTDGGITWTRVYLSTFFYSYAWKMFFNPSGLGVASIEETGGVQTIARTTDNGNNWSTVIVNGAAPVNTHLGGIGMLNDTLGWVSDQADTGTYETQDGGLTWNTIVSLIDHGDRMVLVDSVTMLAVGTTVFKYELGTVGIPSPSANRDANSHALLIFPNPVNDIITIEAIAIANTFGLIDILDEKGMRVIQVTRQRFPKGKSSFPVNLKNLSVGNYKAIWHNNEQLIAKSFSIVR